MLSLTVANILNHEFQAGGDEQTLRNVAVTVKAALPACERAAFTEAVEMCGLWITKGDNA